MTSSKARLLILLLGLFATLVLLGGCNSTEEEAIFLNVKVDSTWTRYDRVMVVLADSSGRTLDTLFWNKLQSPGQLGKLNGSGYDGGSIQVILIGYLGTDTAKKVTRTFDSRTGLSGKKDSVELIPLSAGADEIGEYLHLTDFPWGDDIVHGHFKWKQDLGTVGEPMFIGGKGYARGLGGHSADSGKPEAHVTYNLKSIGRPISSFYAEVGIDDHQTSVSCGSAVFKVYLDTALAYTSPLQTVDLPPLPIRVAVGNATTLKLVLNDAGDGNCGDHGDWGNTRLYLAPRTDYLPNGLWENLYTYFDDTDSIMSKTQINVLDNGAIDWRMSFYEKDENKIYNQLSGFMRIQGTHKLENDSLYLLGETFQDTCCEVLSKVDLESLPKQKVPVEWKNSTFQIRIASTTKFELLRDDGSEFFWSTFNKK